MFDFQKLFFLPIWLTHAEKHRTVSEITSALTKSNSQHTVLILEIQIMKTNLRQRIKLVWECSILIRIRGRADWFSGRQKKVEKGWKKGFCFKSIFRISYFPFCRESVLPSPPLKSSTPPSNREAPLPKMYRGIGYITTPLYPVFEKPFVRSSDLQELAKIIDSMAGCLL